MNRYGVLYNEINNRVHNLERFLKYINDVLRHIEPKNTTNTRCVAIMDKVRFHKMSTIIEAFHIKGHEISYSPPYSSCLNPIEESCRPENETELFNYMSDRLSTRTLKDCDA
ncbi:hypothetical protein RF11_04940 [Thelohanellus kitauei]|uniref:Tc1-like transposase DDE domain-containing protein n=1 Tax=Thelohanellus kitauei TaxID=669202 RepID=A0A0C2N106_THEKT|nr:hypothetical protein RF11_04940 [Thelohanellus kitauei]